MADVFDEQDKTVRELHVRYAKMAQEVERLERVADEPAWIGDADDI